jgi:hypothetical protein
MVRSDKPSNSSWRRIGCSTKSAFSLAGAQSLDATTCGFTRQVVGRERDLRLWKSRAEIAKRDLGNITIGRGHNRAMEQIQTCR